MALYFTDNQIRELNNGFAAIPNKAAGITESFLSRRYTSDSAKEYAENGVARRVATLSRCINQIYTSLPPGFDGLPNGDTRIDTTVFIQAFVFNAFGVLDNLAFVWVNERNIRKRNGHALPNGRIGLTSDKTEVRASFSTAMQTYLASLDPWFSNLENFRHSLGHRIPLYIPPYIVREADVNRYRELETGITNALLRGDIAEGDRLRTERDNLVSFRPWMKQSFTDPTPPVVFHAQVLADFATIEEICGKILEELDAAVA